MKARHAVFVALATAVALTSVAAAAPAATKQRVQIDMKIHPKNTFVLTPLEAGALERDSGTNRCSGEPDISEVPLRDGQEVFPWVCRAWVFTGKGGSSCCVPSSRGSRLVKSPPARIRTTSPRVPGRSCAGPVSTRGSPEAGGVPRWGHRGAGVFGSRATRASSPFRSTPHKAGGAGLVPPVSPHADSARAAVARLKRT